MGNLKGFSLCKHGPRISHLFFANDTLLFCQVRLGDVQAIQYILILYQEASSQYINKTKTNLFFGKFVDAATEEYIKELLGVPEIKEYEKYLGLPDVVGKNERESLNYIKESI